MSAVHFMNAWLSPATKKRLWSLRAKSNLLKTREIFEILSVMPGKYMIVSQNSQTYKKISCSIAWFVIGFVW